jgi:hypothetical protein
MKIAVLRALQLGDGVRKLPAGGVADEEATAVHRQRPELDLRSLTKGVRKPLLPILDLVQVLCADPIGFFGERQDGPRLRLVLIVEVRCFE